MLAVMSLEAVISRIDQIQQLQEQLLPAGTTASVTGGVGVSSGSSANISTADPAQATGSTTNATNFAAALAGAQAASSATTAAPGIAATGATGSTLESAPATVQAMVSTANSLVGKPYVWGGGHSGWGPSAGYDCSGFVSAVLHAGGYLSSPQDTQTLPSSAGIASGPGQYVTIYDRTDATSGSSDHVIIDLGGQFYEAGGEAGSWGGGGGVEQIAAPSAAYLASFNQILHPVGL
jgi:cell wall-associated NlpC family hydrolase